jgi:hypothetical protein
MKLLICLCYFLQLDDTFSLSGTNILLSSLFSYSQTRLLYEVYGSHRVDSLDYNLPLFRRPIPLPFLPTSQLATLVP